MPWRGEQSPGTGGGLQRSQATGTRPRVINLMRVPGINQVQLQVASRNWNRTGLREIGGDFLWCNPENRDHCGDTDRGQCNRFGFADDKGDRTDGDGYRRAQPHQHGLRCLPDWEFELLIQALRQNNLVSILAEPNLVCA